MAKKNSRNTKGKIIAAAWRLFYEQGYDDTTVEEIVAESETSKGSFYHYFDGKDALLSSLSYLFDEKYQQLDYIKEKDISCFDKLIFLNKELFGMIENSISVDLMAKLYSTQLVTKEEKHLLDRSRTYYKLLKQIALEGQEKGEFSDDFTTNEIVNLYAMCERAFIYDWCLSGGEYSLRKHSMDLLPILLKGIVINKE